MNESEVKSKMVKTLREQGGYGRRFEDQYAVGIPDMMLVPVGGPVFMVEAKIIRHGWFGATPRQLVELERIRKTGIIVSLLIGWDDTSKQFYFTEPTERAVTTGHEHTVIKFAPKCWDVTGMLKEWYDGYKIRFG